jgi:hypothetical protein
LKVHLLTFDDTKVSRDAVITKIDRIEAIVNWSAFLPGGICLVSSLPAKELAKEIRKEMPGTHFLVAELDRGRRNGWLPRDVWAFMNDPKAIAG